MSAHLLLKFIKQVGEEIKCQACQAFYHFLKNVKQIQ